MKKSIVIGICGRTASGKSSLAKRIKAYYDQDTVFIISMDDFYKVLNERDHQLALENKIDFDCLESFDLEALCDCIFKAHANEPFTYYLYDHANHRHKDRQITCGDVSVTPTKRNIYIFEGLYLFAVPNIQTLFELKVYIDIEADTSLIRRIKRDIVERRRTVESVLDQYEAYVKPAYKRLVEPHIDDVTLHIQEGAFNDEGFEKIIASIEEEKNIKK